MAKSILVAVAAGVLMLAAPVPSHAQTATSCADCKTSGGAFSITNNTGLTIHYKVKWGTKGSWENANQIVLKSGFTETHSHALDGNNKAPAPYIHLDADVTAAKDFRDAKLKFGQIDHVGYPHPGTHGQPVSYSFFVGDDKKLGLARQN
jgi:hypothetical protein